MSDCRCHAGKICDLHVEEVMGNLNKAMRDIHGGIVGGYSGSPTPEQIDHDIIGELSRLRQKVAELEENKKFYEDIAKDIGKRLNEAEDKLKAIEQQFLEILSHGCCIPVCSKHQGPVEIRGNG